MAAPPTNQVSSLLQANSDESGTCRSSTGGAPSPLGDWAIGYRLWAIAVADEGVRGCSHPPSPRRGC